MFSQHRMEKSEWDYNQLSKFKIKCFTDTFLSWILIDIGFYLLIYMVSEFKIHHDWCKASTSWDISVTCGFVLF